jgi:hypothetical protein
VNDEASAPAGWYPDPTMADTRRYWDGKAWTDHIAPGSAAPAPAVAAPTVAAPAEIDNNNSTLVMVGLATAVFLPLVGFIVGAVLLPRRARDGVIIMIIAVVATVVWIARLS